MKKYFKSTRIILVLASVLTIFAGSVLADDITLDMEGTTATVPKGNTVNRKIFGIPTGIPGTLKLKMKWHAVNLIPNTFNLLKVEVLHGSTVLKSSNCYSLHSNKTPKCDFTISVSQAEADRAGNWSLRVTNNSSDEVIGFNITKESADLNPLVPSFRSVYTPNCPSTVNLDMEGDTATITKGGTVNRKIFGIGKAAGVLVLKAKWHTVNILPTFAPLKIELLKPNGQVAVSGTYYSIHASNTPKFNITYSINSTDAALSGNWSLRITNNSKFEVIGFNMTKESADLNPLVPSFNSTYKATCSF